MNKKLQNLISQLKPEEAKPCSPEPFDWNAFFKSEPTEEEWKNAADRSGSWVTCACGNQCSIIPRGRFEFGDAAPKDNILYWLGDAFYTAIACRDAGRAKGILSRIEARSAFLIEEILKERNV